MRFYPFVFTGNDPRKGWRIPLNEIKYNEQRDEETGYGYFGARYMDHELMTMWLSVDPMADKYPSISPYAYCAWNPVKLVDPNGNEAIENDDWFQNTLTGAVYYNQSMSAQDVGTGAMRGDGWEHLGENNMFSNGDYSNSDIQLVMRYGGSLGVHDDFVDIPPALMLEGDNAKDFMSDRGYSLQPQEAIAVTTTRTTMASEPHEPITLTETNTSNIKVNKWGYEKKGLKGYPSVIKNISYNYEKTSVVSTKETSTDLVKYNYRKPDGLKQLGLSVLREFLKVF